MVEHFINQLMLTITGQCLNQVAIPHISGSQTIAMRFHIFNQILKDFFILRHMKEQGKCIATLASCTILCRILIKESFIKRDADILC